MCISTTLLAALCPVAASILKEQQTQLTLASFLPDVVPKLKFIFEEVALEDLVAVKELLHQGGLLNKQETSLATAQRAVDILVQLGVARESFVVPEVEVYRAKCEWAAMFGLQPAVDLSHDPSEISEHDADFD